MSDRRARAKVDPELRRQLSDPAATEAVPVQAVLRLRPTRRSALVPPPETTRALAEHVVARVAAELGATAGDYDVHVFPNLGYFVLQAAPGFVARVLDQPEVASASANRQRS
jgi:hypothetical protein